MATRRESLSRIGMTVVAVGAFLFAVQLLGRATGALEPQLRTVVELVVDTDPAALGTSWVAAYLLLNGSVVATVALSLFGVGLLSVGQLLLMVAGSRLGAAGVVLLVGALDHVRNPRSTARESMRLGTLSFLVTYSVYLPATLVSYLALPRVVSLADISRASGPVRIAPQSVFAPVLSWLLSTVGPALSFLLAVLVLLGCLSLLDRLFSTVDAATLRERYLGALRVPTVSLLAGFVLTALSTSVAFSLGVVVPLYNRDVVTRREMVPFVLGASVGTLSDTLLVALVLGSPRAVLVVVLLLVVGTLFTLVALATYDSYEATVGRVQDRIVADNRVFVAFVASLAVVPLALAAL